MSLGDHLRYLRALRNVDTQTVADALGLASPAAVNAAEQRYKPVADERLIARLAKFYERSLEEFQWHNVRARKYLTYYIEQAREQGEAVTLILRSGESLHGRLDWWDLGSIALETERGLVVIQRHAVVDWPGAGERSLEEMAEPVN